MTYSQDEHYYQMGRKQAANSLLKGEKIIRPTGLTEKQLQDWLQGFQEMTEMIYWRREKAEEAC